MRGTETSFTFESKSLSYIFQKEIKPIRRGTRWRGEGEHLKQKEKKTKFKGLHLSCLLLLPRIIFQPNSKIFPQVMSIPMLIITNILLITIFLSWMILVLPHSDQNSVVVYGSQLSNDHYRKDRMGFVCSPDDASSVNICYCPATLYIRIGTKCVISFKSTPCPPRLSQRG